MNVIERKAIVPYTDAQMFALVDDIEHYPDFLPWCHSASIHDRGTDYVEASIEVSGMGMQKSFSTRNQLIPHTAIELTLVDGPFEYLKGQWAFRSLGEEGCEVSLHLEYTLKGGWSMLAFGPMFSHVVGSLVDAFSQRAHEVYGR